MKLLFIQGGSRLRYDQSGDCYTDTNFNNRIWARYKSYCSELTVILRKDDTTYNDTEAKKRFNPLDKSLMKLVAVPDITNTVKKYFDFNLRKGIKKIIEEEVCKADKVIIRSVVNFYTETAFKMCLKHKKSYLIEVTGYAFEALWHHSLKGKFVAPFKEMFMKRSLTMANHAIYVTNDALQKRYPSYGRNLGCSDVDIDKVDNDVLLKRLEKINLKKGEPMVLGTAALLDVKWKGQKNVLKALAYLKKQGICSFKYQLIGVGKGNLLRKEIKRYGLYDCVEIIGALPHERIFDWFDSVDIYVQPSYQEGLCRSIIEAMSRACPVIASDVGGNYELIEKDCLFKKGNHKQLANKLLYMIDNDELSANAKRNFEKAKEFQKDVLDVKRDKFYKEFMNQ